MAKPSARKSSAPPPRARKKTPRPTNSRPKKGGECSACGLKVGHAEGCPNSSCAECGMMAGSHTLDCPRNSMIEREPALDGTTGGPVIETDVDGKAAKVKVTKAPREEAPAKKPMLTLIQPPRLKNAAAAIAAIQLAIDEKRIFGIKQALTKTEQCGHEWFDEKSNQSVGCLAAAVFDFEETATCPTCKKASKSKDDPLCLVHMGMKQMNELPARQTDMFAGADEDESEGDGE